MICAVNYSACMHIRALFNSFILVVQNNSLDFTLIELNVKNKIFVPSVG